ncbi:MAG: hypothetical protein ACFCVG_13345, partial [Kineosporiaceae bacterium]
PGRPPLSVTLGYRYGAGAFVPGPDDPAPPEDDATPDLSAAPGARLPATRLPVAGRETSSLRLIGPRPVLIVGPQAGSGPWQEAADRAGLDVARVDDAGTATFTGAHGVGPAGAVLVRPDGVVAFRSSDLSAPAAAASLDHACRVLHGHPVPATLGGTP